MTQPTLTRTRRCEAGVTPCGEPGQLYPCGWRCPQHTPAAAADRPEPPPTRAGTRCQVCRRPLDPTLAAAGDLTHPTCGEPA